MGENGYCRHFCGKVDIKIGLAIFADAVEKFFDNQKIAAAMSLFFDEIFLRVVPGGHVKGFPLFHAIRDVELRLAVLGNDAGAYGAFKLVLDAK